MNVLPAVQLVFIYDRRAVVAYLGNSGHIGIGGMYWIDIDQNVLVSFSPTAAVLPVCVRRKSYGSFVPM